MKTEPPTVAADIEEAYRAEGDRLFYALLAYSGDPEIARESVAEAFARAIASAAAIREIVPWVWQVSFRLAAAELRHRSRLAPLTEIQDHPAPVPTDLFEALARLSDRQRATIVLHYAGYPLDEIAALLGTRRGTVGVHLYRARLRLRRLLEEHDG
jgi:RNA polymerase sigma factor (sigma-70 family)